MAGRTLEKESRMCKDLEAKGSTGLWGEKVILGRGQGDGMEWAAGARPQKVL